MKNTKTNISIAKTFESVGVNTEHGFCHVVTVDDLTIQCCLVQRADEKGYKKEIIKDDCGETEGICGDVNEKSFEKYGKENCMQVLFSEMRKNGVRII